MSLLSTIASTLSVLTRRNVSRLEVVRMDAVTTTLLSPTISEQQTKPQPPVSVIMNVTGTGSYNAFRRFLFRSTHQQAIKEFMQNPHILIEREGDPGQIYVEADGKRILHEAEDGVRVISARYVLGIIYHSRSGKTELFWRDDTSAGKIWGRVTRKSLGMLLGCNIRVKTSEALAVPILHS